MVEQTLPSHWAPHIGYNRRKQAAEVYEDQRHTACLSLSPLPLILLNSVHLGAWLSGVGGISEKTTVHGNSMPGSRGGILVLGSIEQEAKSHSVLYPINPNTERLNKENCINRNKLNERYK